MIEAPYPELNDLLTMMGEAGRHLAEIEASEGAAGNISVCLRWPIEVRTRFPVVDDFELPQPVPELAGATFLVSGSGRRLAKLSMSRLPISPALLSIRADILEKFTHRIIAASSR